MAGLNQSSATQRARGLISFAICTLIFAGSRVLHDGDIGISLCLFRHMTGLPCPSCGMTRAFCALARGDLPSALALNLASPLVFVGTVTTAVLGASQALGGRALLSDSWRVANRVVVPLLLGTLGVAWTRNLVGAFGR